MKEALPMTGGNPSSSGLYARGVVLGKREAGGRRTLSSSCLDGRIGEFWTYGTGDWCLIPASRFCLGVQVDGASFGTIRCPSEVWLWR